MFSGDLWDFGQLWVVGGYPPTRVSALVVQLRYYDKHRFTNLALVS